MSGEITSAEGRTGKAAGPRKRPEVGRLLRVILPWVMTFLVFIYVFHQVPFPEVMASFRLVRLSIFVPIVLILFLVFLISDALCNHLVFTWLTARTRFFEVLLASGAARILEVVNVLIGRGGIGYWLSKTKKIPPSEATGAVVFIVYMDVLAIFVVSSIGLVLMPEINLSDFFAATSEGFLVRVVSITLTLLALDVCIWLTKPELWLFRWFRSRGPFVVFDRVRVRHFVIILVIKLIVYPIDFLGAWLALRAFGLEIPLAHIFTYLPLIYLIGSIPITVLGLATTQAAWLYFFADPAPPATIVAFSLLWSVGYIAPSIGTGLACLPRVLRDLRD